MKILSTKINRYIIPSILILLVAIIPIAKLGIKMLPFLLIIGIFEILFYFLFVSSIGRLIKNDLLAIMFNMCLLYLGFGVFFIIMHWPNGVLHMMAGKVLLILVVILAFFLVFFNKKKSN